MAPDSTADLTLKLYLQILWSMLKVLEWEGSIFTSKWRKGVTKRFQHFLCLLPIYKRPLHIKSFSSNEKKKSYKIKLRNLIKQMLNPSQANNNKHLLNLIIFKHIWASSNKNTLLKWYLGLRKFTEFMLMLLTSCWWNTEIMLLRLTCISPSPVSSDFSTLSCPWVVWDKW